MKNADPKTSPLLYGFVNQKKADIGIAHDGDGDRVRFVDSDGKLSMAIKCLEVLARQAQQDKALQQSTFITTVHSNSGLLSFLSENNINGLTADVGDRNVYLKMLKPIVIGVVNLQVISYVRTTSQPETVYLLHSLYFVQ